MSAFAVGDEPRIAVLTGVAGQAQRRLLREVAREHDRRHGAVTQVPVPGPSPRAEGELFAEQGLVEA